MKLILKVKSLKKMYKLADYHLYGSSAHVRLATWKPDNVDYDVTIYTPEASSTLNSVVSQKEFEFKDHLENVWAVVIDKVINIFCKFNKNS